jgi:hypothetical protein
MDERQAFRSILFPIPITSIIIGHSPVKEQKKQKRNEHTTARIRWWSPTQLLIRRSVACVWQSGRDAQYSTVYGRM